MWELCSGVNEGRLGVIASLRIGLRVCCACDACSHYRDHAMFLRSSSQPFIAFLKTRHLTRCLHRLTVPPIGHRVSSVRSFTTPAPQVAQRFGVALSFVLHIRDDHCKKTPFSCFRQNSFLQQSEYDALADAAMEGLLDRLQDILDSHRDSSLEVEYNVRVSSLGVYLAPPFHWLSLFHRVGSSPSIWGSVVRM